MPDGLSTASCGLERVSAIQSVHRHSGARSIPWRSAGRNRILPSCPARTHWVYPRSLRVLEPCTMAWRLAGPRCLTQRSIPASAGEPIAGRPLERKSRTGLSPRLRGNLVDPKRRAGNVSAVYPRVCGGTAGMEADYGRVESRSIPASAGEPPSAGPSGKQTARGSIPASAGEPSAVQAVMIDRRLQGLSPRLRGNRRASTPSARDR